MAQSSSLKTVSDDDLLRRLSDLIRRSRRAEAEIVAHIAEVDARRLYAGEATPSMFVYCVKVLRLGESEAYLRIAAARASREHPQLLAMLRDGRLLVSAVARLASHLTPENCESVLRRAANRSKREIEELIAELDPKPDVPAVIRQLPTPRASTAPEGGLDPSPCLIAPIAPTQLVPERVESTIVRPDAEKSPSSAVALRSRGLGHRSTVEPLSPSRHKVQFTASDELRDKLERLQALMRTTVPDGDLATIIDLAVTEKLERLEAQRFGRTSKPRKALADTDITPSSRHIPTPVRRAVYERDGGRCTYEDHRGRRCGVRERLEFHHHRTPFGKGGEHSVENLRLVCQLCRIRHNRHYAESRIMPRRGARTARVAAIVTV